MASCRVSRGLGLRGLAAAAAAAAALASSDALDLDIRQVLVLAVVAEPEESFLEELRFESWEGFLVTSQEEARRFGSRSLRGIPQ